MQAHNNSADKMDPPGLHATDETESTKLQGGIARKSNDRDDGTSWDANELQDDGNNGSVGMQGMCRLSNGEMMAKCVLCPRPSSDAISAVEQHLEYARVQAKHILVKRSDFRAGKREKLREHLKCLNEIYQRKGTSETFIYLFKKTYAIAQKDHFLPREDGERRSHCIHQIWQNLVKSFEKQDYCHFTWFMYMFMKFMLEEEEVSGRKEDA